MRLTLRTMLAYLDDILEPADAQELGKKIEQSDVASGIVHRIRSSMRRLRLGAPVLDGTGMGGDANTVAEYLDNTLPSEQLAEFEKACLDSDVNLAEVASGHQILTLVLGEEAEVSTALRERMYRIHAGEQRTASADSTDEKKAEKTLSGSVAAATAPAAASPATGDKVEAKSKKEKAEVPDYLRASRKVSPARLALTIALAFLLATVALRALGPFDASHPLLGMFVSSDPVDVAIVPDDQEPTDDPAPVDPQPDDPKPDDVTPDNPQPDDPMPDDTPDDEPVVEPAPVDPVDEPVPPVDPVDKPVPPMDDPAPDPFDKPDEPADPSEDAPTDKPDEPLVVASLPDTDPNVPAPPDDTPKEVGRFISAEQVLLRLDEKSDAWMRVPQLSTLSTGEHLLVLPAFRPQIVLTSGVQFIFVGESEVFTDATAEGMSSVALRFGRALLYTDGKPGAQIHLNLNGRQGTVAFSDAESTFAVDVQPFLPPGADPTQAAAHNVVKMFVTSGQISWTESNDGPEQTLELKAGQSYLILDDQPGETVANYPLPEWVDPKKSVRETDRLAYQELEPFLVKEKPVSVSLLERVDYRQADVRSLTARSLSYLDQFEPLVDQLADKRQKSYWASDVEALQHAIARGPETAAKVRVALEKRRGEDAVALFRLLWGFSPGQLAKGADKQLVEFLSHEQMDVRMLAYTNLKAITGKTELFRPERDANQQKSAIIAWQRNFEEGRILYKDMPSPWRSADLVDPPEPKPAVSDPKPVDPAETSPETPEAEPDADEAKPIE